MSISNQFRAEEFCSRKLLNIVSGQDEKTCSKEQLHAALAELETRRHYLQELKQLGVFTRHQH
jgi:hypothetical protein